jgi:hypothetical protein
MIRTLTALSVFAVTVFAQSSVSPENMYHRVYAVVPMVGSGTSGDPRRPMLVPLPSTSSSAASGRPGLLGFQMQPSDDGRFALVEFVFQSPVSYHNFLIRTAAAATTAITIGVPSLPRVSVSQLSEDGSNLKALNQNLATLKASFEAAVPGMHLLERGKSSDAAILATFRTFKASYTFGANSVRPQ